MHTKISSILISVLILFFGFPVLVLAGDGFYVRFNNKTDKQVKVEYNASASHCWYQKDLSDPINVPAHSSAPQYYYYTETKTSGLVCFFSNGKLALNFIINGINKVCIFNQTENSCGTSSGCLTGTCNVGKYNIYVQQDESNTTKFSFIIS